MFQIPNGILYKQINNVYLDDPSNFGQNSHV